MPGLFVERLVFNLNLMVVTTRSWSLPMSAPGKDLVLLLIKVIIRKQMNARKGRRRRTSVNRHYANNLTASIETSCEYPPPSSPHTSRPTCGQGPSKCCYCDRRRNPPSAPHSHAPSSLSPSHLWTVFLKVRHSGISLKHSEN